MRIDRSAVVDSTALKSVGYDAASETLDVEFNTAPGRVYRYSTVPASVYNGLMSASSKGGYYNANIKGRYPSNRIDP